MVAKELTKAAGLENIFRTLNKADNMQLAIVTVFAEGFSAGIKATQTSAELLADKRAEQAAEPPALVAK